MVACHHQGGCHFLPQRCRSHVRQSRKPEHWPASAFWLPITSSHTSVSPCQGTGDQKPARERERCQQLRWPREALKNVVAWEETMDDFPALSAISPRMLGGGGQEPFPPASAPLLLDMGLGELRKQAQIVALAWLEEKDGLPGTRRLGTGDGDVCEGDKGTAGDGESRGTEPGRS